MKDFLRKIKLIDTLTTEVPIEKSEFIAKFRMHVDQGEFGMFSDMFDVFSSSKNEYKGYVGFDKFKIKRRRKFFDMNMNMAVAEGTYRQNDENLTITAEVNGFHGMMIPFYIFLVAFYALFIVIFLITDGTPPVFIPFIILHGAFMFGIPYWVMRRSVKRMKHDLEREFFFLTKP